MSAPQELRIAVFGMSESGKTVLLSSYYGNQQRNAFEERHGYRLEAEDASQGNDLLAHYYRMESGTFPRGTDRFAEYRFGLRVGDMNDPGMRLVWYDYPGGWWASSPKDEVERVERQGALRNLVTSQVGLLLVDGSRYAEEGVAYVRHVLDQFKNEARKIVRTLSESADPNARLPQQWVIAVTKADLLPEGTNAEAVCKDVVSGCQDQLKGLARVFQSSTFGRSYLLLSAVRGDGDVVVDAHSYVGLQLIAPVALMAAIQRLAEKAPTGRAFGVLAFVVERLKALVEVADELDDFLPATYQPISRVLEALAANQVLDEGAQALRDRQRAAARAGKVLEATAAAMGAELKSDAAQNSFFVNQ